MRLKAQMPARGWAFACGLVLLASCMLAASASAWVPQLSPLFSSALAPDPDTALPAPTRYSYRGIHTTMVRNADAPLRIRLEAVVPAELGNVLSFYRSELGKRGWHEQRDGAVVATDHVRLGFVSPLGPAVLELGRQDNSTAVHLVEKNAGVATRANVLPEPGQAKLLFSNIGDQDAVLTVSDRTIERAAGANAAALDLPPGRYSYALGVPGHTAITSVLTVAAGETWELTVGRDGEAWPPLQLY